ncbi:MAG TPA: MerR family transcriptional regulator [Ktedonobacterales bacterium]|nr:MerR family transcriptional regulator [Ktedonobacterales bacterium]
MDTGFTIQQVAQRSGLSIDTLRYYERIGLLAPVARASSGHRRYMEHDLAWIELLIRLRDTGMPLAQMVRFAQLRRQGDATIAERRLLLEEHQRALEEHMRVLERHTVALQQKIARLRECERRLAPASIPARATAHGETGATAGDLGASSASK